jgi:hypothetical protein
MSDDHPQATDDRLGRERTVIGRLFYCLFGKREAAVIRHLVLTEAQAQVDAQKILAGKTVYSNGKLLPVQKEQGEHDEDAGNSRSLTRGGQGIYSKQAGRKCL